MTKEKIIKILHQYNLPSSFDPTKLSKKEITKYMDCPVYVSEKQFRKNCFWKTGFKV